MTMTATADRDPGSFAYPLYQDAGLLERALVKGRPYICPFAPLVDWVPRGARVFDIGCGCGLWLMTLGARGVLGEGIGCDINQRALSVAGMAAARLRDSSTEADVPVRFFEAAEMSEWPDDEFDVVSIIDVVHHVPPQIQQQFLLNAWKRVRPGGRLIYKDMASKPAVFALANALHDLLLARQIIHYLPIEKARTLLSDSGGKVVHEAQWRRGPYAHELMVVEK